MHYHSLVIRVTQVSVSGITKYLSRIRRRSTVAEGDSKALTCFMFHKDVTRPNSKEDRVQTKIIEVRDSE